MKMKPIKVFGTSENVTYYQSSEEVLIPVVYREKEEEMRGIWFSTVANIDFPQMIPENDKVPETEIIKLKEYLRGVISKVKEYHLNTIIFQVRPVNDALYASKLNPQSSVLTGTEGTDPGFDVFGFFVEEAKKAGIGVHAWINPYRAGRSDITKMMKDGRPFTKEDLIKTLSPDNFASKHPECTILTRDNKLLLDPADERVREFVSDTVIEIASGYDIEAIHIDDYFYPYEGINDPNEEKKAKAAGFTSLPAFRRHNVDLMIELIHHKLGKLPRKPEFGVSPFGIYRINKKYFGDRESEKAWEYGSFCSPACLTDYADLYADIYKWMEKGWIDYVVPQVYFDFDNTVRDEKGNSKCLVKYADLVRWWSEAAARTSCKLYIGQALYRVGTAGNWLDPEETANQLRYNSLYENAAGTVFFTYNSLNAAGETAVKAREILKTLWTKDVPVQGNKKKA